MKEKRMAALVERFRAAFGGDCQRLHEAILAGPGAGGSQVIQFAASQFGEGTTTISLGFGRFLADIHGPDHVVVVEGNLRAPSFHDIFRLASPNGLQAVLEGRAQVEQAVLQVGDGGIFILPADYQGGRTDLVALDSLRTSLGRVVADLRSRFLFVLIDSPPIVPFFDGCILSSIADAVVFIIESNRTRAEVVDHAIDSLRSRGATILGVVLNKRVFHIPNYMYRFL